MKIKLTNWGLDDTLRDMKNNLCEVLGRDVSKNAKDAAMYEVIGSIEALYNLIAVEDEETEEDKTEEVK
jgi:hypothetical protein